MKKVITLVFAVLLLIGIAACGGGSDGSSNPGGVFEPDDPDFGLRDGVPGDDDPDGEGRFKGDFRSNPWGDDDDDDDDDDDGTALAPAFT